ncbi:MAG TPA: NADP-dependent oxidoreductase [Solimonas sp.]
MSAVIRYRLARIPAGLPDAQTWERTQEPGRAPEDGEVRLAVRYISVDPAMSGWIQPVRSYAEPVKVGEVMKAFAIGEVVESRSERHAIGDVLFGLLGVQSEVTIAAKGLRRLDPKIVPLPKYLGGLGMPGFTGYFGLTEIGQPQEGETVVVSAAAGAVGSVVCQVAKIRKAKVIGIAGGADKCQYLRDEVGCDEAIDYKAEDVGAALDRVVPEGVDVYFDNVGGKTLDAVLARIRRHARIVVCGGVSQYGSLKDASGPANYLQLVAQSGRMQGFTMLDYLSRIPEAGMQLGAWMMQGKLKTREHILDGIDQFPSALPLLFAGGNRGKLMIKV